MKYKSVGVKLESNDGRYLWFRYNVLAGESGQIWCDCLKQAQTSSFAENKSFYNFPHKEDQSLNFLLKELDRVREELRKMHPTLVFPQLDQNKLAESINHMHQNFAHGHLVERLINSQNSFYWTEFNRLLHAIEAAHYSEAAMRSSDLPDARMVLTWKQPNRVAIPEAVYSEYSLKINFGFAYFNYAQVGRQILEIYMAQDHELPIEHIQPARFFSADTSFWFGRDLSEETVEVLKNKIHKWFLQNKKLTDELCLKWGDPRLAIGRVPVAKLVNMPTEQQDRVELIKKISQFDFVSEVELA